MSRTQPTCPRRQAAQVLDAVLYQGRSLKAALDTALPQLSDSRDRALLEAIVFCAIRLQAPYHAALEAWLRTPLARRDNRLKALLLAGFAQLHGLQLAPHAAVAETVNAARALGYAQQAGLVNALLRRLQREGLPALPIEAGWPDWLLQQIQTDWPWQWQAIVQASLVPAPLWLRVNRRKTTLAAYQARLQQAQIHARPHPFLADGLCLESSVAVGQLPDFADGHVSVQDGSAQKLADAMDADHGALRVLDACAAPGGKSAHLLERNAQLQLTALEINARRLRRMGETFQRLGLQAIIRQADASAPKTWWDGQLFDRIVVDAPCSASGIIRRQPDILLHRQARDVAALTATQAALLDSLWPLLAPGGRFVYATCSILQAENSAQIRAFLARHTDARLLPLDASFGHDTGAGAQRLPGEEGMDGFFIAVLQKV